MKLPKPWNLHTHSAFSAQDALPRVDQVVAAAAALGQPAIGLTDHGNMAGAAQLYQHARRHGLAPFPGTELYLAEQRPSRAFSHLTVFAVGPDGYRNLVNLSDLSHKQFYYRPNLDLADLAALADDGRLTGVSASSGCLSGMVARAVIADDLDRARSLLRSFDLWFDGFYVELQNHLIELEGGGTDDELADALMGLADELGLPCVLAQDSHYVQLSDKQAHETMKWLVSWDKDNPESAIFDGDGYPLADTDWFLRHHHPERYLRGLEGLTDLLSRNEVSIPQLDEYHYNIPFTVEAPEQHLRDRCTAELESRGLSRRYRKRLDHEMGVVAATGMTGYLVLVAQVTDWLREQGIFYQARGSASSSILCWLLGITQVDPLKHGLVFERFISTDRTKPPDIDLDIEHTRRQDLIDWLETRFAVHQIGTWRSLKMDSGDEDTKGSLLRRYYQRSRQLGGATVWADIPEDHRQLLRLVSDSPALDGSGTHPAGLIVTTSREEYEHLVPSMTTGSGLVSQYDMGDVEGLGLVKLDALGLKTLSTLSLCMRNLGRDVADGLDWIPLDDAKTYRAISKGDTDGVFQLEGRSAQSGVQQLHPRRLADVVAAMALFRKATMSTGATEAFIRRRHGAEALPRVHDDLSSIIGETMGIFLYQEQVLMALGVLGLGPEDKTRFLKAIKASNADIGGAHQVIESYRGDLLARSTARGWSTGDWDFFWSAVEGYAEYGFNKSHAVAYGLTAYRCAYLLTNHPVEFLAAQLAVFADDTERQPRYIRAARKRGIKVRAANVNLSGMSYTVDRTGSAPCIRYGVNSVEGLGPMAAKRIVEARPPGGYLTVRHFCELVGTKPVTGTGPYIKKGDRTVGVLGALFEAGVMDGLVDEE